MPYINGTFIPRAKLRFRVVSEADDGREVAFERLGSGFKLYMGSQHCPKDRSGCNKVQAVLQYQIGSRKVVIRSCGAYPVVVYPQKESRSGSNRRSSNSSGGDADSSSPPPVEVRHMETADLAPGDCFTLLPDSRYRFRLEAYGQAETQPQSTIGRKVVHKRVMSKRSPEIEGCLNRKERQAAAWRLAFPFLPPPWCKFDQSKALQIAVEEISQFLESHPQPAFRRLQLVLVERSKDVPVFEAFRQQWTAEGRDPRLQFHVGDMTQLRTAPGGVASIPCCSVVCPSDRCLSTVQPLVKAIFDRAGGREFRQQSLAALKARIEAVEERDDSDHLPSCNSALVFWTPTQADSPLALEAVEAVFHVCCPNLNPSWPHCLPVGDYSAPEHHLRSCYTAMLASFVNHVSTLHTKWRNERKGDAPNT